jgi:hypothetical protein
LVLSGIAAIWMARAWIIWAGRCHPKGTFKHPSRTRATDRNPLF